MSDRKKAIETLKQLRLDYEEFYEEHNNEVTQAYDMAIASLETDEAYQLEYERTTKNDLVTLTFSKGTLKYSCKDYVVYKKDWLRSHYGAEIDIMFGDSQYKEPTTKNDLGVEKIVDILGSYTDLDIPYKHKIAEDILNNLSSVTPIRPKGHWIVQPSNKEQGERDFSWWKCSECGQVIFSETEHDRLEFHSFCGRCGSDNRELEQDPRKGEWIRISNLSEQEDDRYKCSHCGNVIHYKTKMDLYTFNSWCGRCGSDNGRHINYEVEK